MYNAIRLLAAAIALMLGAGCGHENQNNTVIDPKGIISFTPELHRLIPADRLRVLVSVNASPSVEYLGSNFTDGVWNISVDLVENQDNALSLTWFDNELLLMEESGTVFADPDSPAITPDFEFLTAGYPRFDADCDGVSKSTKPDDSVIATVSKFYRSFVAANYAPRITEVKQAVRIRQTNPGVRSNYIFTLRATEEDSSVRYMQIHLRNDLDDKRFLWVTSSSSAFTLDSDTEGAACVEQTNGRSFCSVPFDWNADQWYEMRLTEIGINQWQAELHDTQTNITMPIATIDFGSTSSLVWRRAYVTLQYPIPTTIDQCQQGLQPIGMEFMPAVFNSEIDFVMQAVAQTACLLNGGGFEDSHRMIGEDSLYTLTLGRSG